MVLGPKFFLITSNSLWLNRNLNYPIQLIFKDVISFFDILQLKPVGDEGRGVDFALLDEGKDFGAVTAVYTAGFEG